MANLKNLSENENMDVYDNEVEDEASLMPTNQESHFESQGASKSKKVNGFDINDNIYKLSIAVESVANSITQSTDEMIEASHAGMESTTIIIRECFANPNPLQNYDVWGMLTDLGISQPFLTDAYVFLIRDPKMLEGLIRCQNEHRKSLLLRVMGHDLEPHN